MHYKRNSLVNRLKNLILNGISIIFKAVSFLNLSFKSFAAQEFPGIFIVSVDNLSFGGTGKTTLVTELGRQLETRGIKFAVVTRGYRSRFETSGTRVQDFHTVADVGDEARMYKDKFPRRDIYVGSDRENSIRLAMIDNNRVVFLDDGFQSTNIKKDFAVMLINPSHPYFYLRNFKFMMKRENVVLVYEDAPGEGGFKRKNHKGPRFGGYRFESAGYRDGSGSPMEIGSEPVVAFSALGDNRRFFEELRDRDLDIKDFRSFRDHHDYDLGDIETLEAWRNQHKARYLICTEKDFVKIKPYNLQQIPFIYAENSIKFNVDIVNVIIEYAEKKNNRQTPG